MRIGRLSRGICLDERHRVLDLRRVAVDGERVGCFGENTSSCSR